VVLFIAARAKEKLPPSQCGNNFQWTMFTNLKAMLAQEGSAIYKGFEPFTTADTKWYIGLMMLHGLSPSPRISYKFSDQATDPVNGNDFVKESFGKNASAKKKRLCLC
jgi:hypothetical protein